MGHMDKCPKEFECPAFHRPVQKSEEAFLPWAWDICLHANSEFLNKCCKAKYLCVQSCGTKIQECYDIFWECAESVCKEESQKWDSDEEQCLRLAAQNSIQFLHSGPNPDELGFFTCETIYNFQKEACDCVQEVDYDAAIEGRFEDFYLDHEPHMLNKKGKIKDRKEWRKMKGKRGKHMWMLMMTHQDKLLKTSEVPKKLRDRLFQFQHERGNPWKDGKRDGNDPRQARLPKTGLQPG